MDRANIESVGVHFKNGPNIESVGVHFKNGPFKGSTVGRVKLTTYIWSPSQSPLLITKRAALETHSHWFSNCLSFTPS